MAQAGKEALLGLQSLLPAWVLRVMSSISPDCRQDPCLVFAVQAATCYVCVPTTMYVDHEVCKNGHNAANSCGHTEIYNRLISASWHTTFTVHCNYATAHTFMLNPRPFLGFTLG